MKYKIDELRFAEKKDLDVTRFFPTATEAVTITIRRLTVRKRNEVLALMMSGQRFGSDGASLEIKDTTWFQKAREIELINCVVINESFPFEKWDKQIIDEIDERCPEMIQFLQDEMQELNRPLALKNGET